MTTPYGKNIIRGANVKGVVFHSPSMLDIPKQPAGTKKTLMEEEYYHGLVKGHQQGYEAGRHEGHEMGFKEGVASLQSELERSVAILKDVLEAFRKQQENLFDHVKPELIKFSICLCEKILRQELENPKKFIKILEHLLDMAKSAVKDVPVQIYVSFEDFERLQNHFGEFPEAYEEIRGLGFVVDAALESGNCRIESSLGLVNLDIKRILDDIEQKTLEA